jgi:hypothetical protein
MQPFTLDEILDGPAPGFADPRRAPWLALRSELGKWSYMTKFDPRAWPIDDPARQAIWLAERRAAFAKHLRGDARVIPEAVA